MCAYTAGDSRKGALIGAISVAPSCIPQCNLDCSVSGAVHICSRFIQRQNSGILEQSPATTRYRIQSAEEKGLFISIITTHRHSIHQQIYTSLVGDTFCRKIRFQMTRMPLKLKTMFGLHSEV